MKTLLILSTVIILALVAILHYGALSLKKSIQERDDRIWIAGTGDQGPRKAWTK